MGDKIPPFDIDHREITSLCAIATNQRATHLWVMTLVRTPQLSTPRNVLTPLDTTSTKAGHHQGPGPHPQ